MKSFLISLVAITVISIGAKIALEQTDMSAQSVFSTDNASVRN